MAQPSGNEDVGRIASEASGSSPPLDSNPSLGHSQIPDSLLFRISNVSNVADFVSQFVDGYDESTLLAGESPFLEASFASPEPATCMPTKQLIEFPKPANPNYMLFPSCTRVPRCGGCCTSPLLNCEPTASTNVTYKVMEVGYSIPGGGSFAFLEHVFVTVEKHDRCRCQCRQKPSDCNSLQRYEGCRCICTNTADMQRCVGSDRSWDNTVCRCKCRGSKLCSSGFYYDTTSCKCQPLRGPETLSSFAPNPQVLGPYQNSHDTEETKRSSLVTFPDFSD